MGRSLGMFYVVVIAFSVNACAQKQVPDSAINASTQQQKSKPNEYGEMEAEAPDAVPVVSVTSASASFSLDHLRPTFYNCYRHVLKIKKRIGQPPEEIYYSPMRVLKPSSTATIDHNITRLNIHVDDSGNVISASCA